METLQAPKSWAVIGLLLAVLILLNPQVNERHHATANLQQFRLQGQELDNSTDNGTGLGVASSCSFEHMLEISCNNLPLLTRTCSELGYSSMAALCATDYGQAQLRALVADGFKERYSYVSSGSGVVPEAFVSFVTGDQYADLATNALRGAMEFTTQPVLLFVGGALSRSPKSRWPPEAFPRIVVFEMPQASMHPWFDKLRSILLSPVRYGAILEADTLPTWHSGRVFGMLAEHADTAHPLLPVHQDARLPDCAGYEGTSACLNTYPYPAEKRTLHYMHAHVFWTVNAKDFIAAVLQTCGLGTETFVGSLDCASDEAALNTALWNTKAKKQVALIPGWDAFTAWETHDWLNVPRADTFRRRHVVFIYVHGHKELAMQEDLLRRIRAIGREPAWWHGPAPGGSEMNGPYIWGNDTQLLLQAISGTGYLM